MPPFGFYKASGGVLTTKESQTMTLAELQVIRLMFPELITWGDLRKTIEEGASCDLENLER